MAYLSARRWTRGLDSHETPKTWPDAGPLHFGRGWIQPKDRGFYLNRAGGRFAIGLIWAAGNLAA